MLDVCHEDCWDKRDCCACATLRDLSRRIALIIESEEEDKRRWLKHLDEFEVATKEGGN